MCDAACPAWSAAERRSWPTVCAADAMCCPALAVSSEALCRCSRACWRCSSAVSVPACAVGRTVSFTLLSVLFAWPSQLASGPAHADTWHPYRKSAAWACCLSQARTLSATDGSTLSLPAPTSSAPLLRTASAVVLPVSPLPFSVSCSEPRPSAACWRRLLAPSTVCCRNSAALACHHRAQPNLITTGSCWLALSDSKTTGSRRATAQTRNGN